MQYFQEIILKPGIDISIYFLWSKVFQQLHLALVEIQDAQGKVPIGVGFPTYNQNQHHLGNKLRVFAPEESQLEELNLTKWLANLTEYITLTGVRLVPNRRVSQYAIYKRKQPKSNIERIARRKAKRENMSFEDALKALKNMKSQQINTPFIQMKSLSSNHRYRLFVQKEIRQEAIFQGFSSYGLSSTSTVPEF